MKICIAEQCPVDLWTVRQFIIALTAFFGRAIRTPRLLPFLLPTTCPSLLLFVVCFLCLLPSVGRVPVLPGQCGTARCSV